MPRFSSNEPTRHGDGLRRLLLPGAPLINVVAVNAKAEEIGRNEPCLPGLKADVTDDHAVSRGYQPTLPMTLADQDCRADRKNAGNVIKTHEDGFVQFMITSFIRNGNPVYVV